MAGKKLRTGETDLDSALDFNDFEFDIEGAGEDRQPTSKPVKSFARGVKKGIGDTDLIKNILRKNLPKEYGDTFDQLEELSRGGRNFAEGVMKEAKPAIANLANAAEKFLPNNFRATKNKLDKIRQWAEKGEEHGYGQDKDDQRNDQIGIELGRAFERQAAIDSAAAKVERNEKIIDRGIGMAQHKDVLSILYKISGHTQQVSAYTAQVTSQWQKKSLETQYRSLFIQQDILEETKKSNAEVLAHLVSITKNTALPEYRKTQQDEAFLEEARRKFSGKIVDASQNFLKRGLQKMKEDVTGVVGDITNITSMMSLAADMQAMEDEFDPKTLTDRFSEAGGKKVGQFMTSKAGKKVFAMLKKNPKAVENILKGQQFIRSFQQDGAGLASNMFDKGKDKGGLIGFLSQYLGDTFTLKEPSYGLQGYNAKNLHQASPFTNKVALSMTDVIPGYLARILQEQTRMRTGKEADLVKYDFRSGKFSTSNKIIESIKKSISSEELSRNNDYYLKDVLAAIEDNVDLTPEERDDIAKALLKKGVDGTSMNPSKMTDTDHWSEHLKEYKTAEKMAQAMKEIYGTDSDKEFYGTGMKASKKASANDFIQKVKGLKELRKDLYSQAQFLMDNDMLDEAQKADLIDRFENLNIDLIDRNSTRSSGSYKGKGEPKKDINAEYAGSKTDLDGHDSGMVQKAADLLKKGYKKATGGFTQDASGYLVDGNGERKLDDDGNPIIVGTSDVHAKRDLTKPGKDVVLSQLSRLPMYNWRYKDGIGDSGATTNMGPTAQDLRKQFGDKAAPGGTTIDLVNANGIAMKAIQELDNKLNSFTGGGGEGNGNGGGGGAGFSGMASPMNAFDALMGIYHNTSELVKQNKSMLNINVEGFKSMLSGLGGSFADMDLSGMGAEAKKRFEAGMSGMKTGSSSLLGKLGDFVSYMTGETISGGIRRGKQLGGALWAGAKASGNFVSNMVGNAKVKALETFDVYVEGEDEPRMVAIKMKQGLYTDAKTGESIKTRQQMRNAVNGVKETNGENTFFVIRKKEMDKVFFVNTYKNAVERLVVGAAGILKSGAKTALDNIISPAFKGGFELSKKMRGLAMNLMDQPLDIFVVGKPDEPALVAKKMRGGDYIDFASGEPIERPSQIKGAVWDRVKNEIAVTVDDIRSGLVDIHGKKIEGSALWRGGKLVVGTALAAGFHIGKWSLDKLSKGVGVLGSLSRKGSEMLGGLASKIGMPSINFGGESVDILKDIREILRYQAGLTSDFKDLAGVVGDSKIATKAKEAIKEAVEGTETDEQSGPGMFGRMKDSIKGWFGKKNKRKGVPEANAGGAMVPYRRGYDEITPIDNSRPETYGGSGDNGVFGLLGSAAGGLLGWGGRKALGTNAAQKYLPSTMKNGLDAILAPNKGNESNQPQLQGSSARDLILGAIQQKKRRDNSGAEDVAYRDVNERKGSWQERTRNARNINKESAMEKAKVRIYETKNIFSMIAKAVGGLKDKLLGGKDDEAVDLLTQIRNILGAQAAAGGVGDIPGVDTGGSGKADKKGRKGRGGKGGRLAKFGKFAGKSLGVAGAAYGAYSAYDNITQGNYGEAALDAGIAAAGVGMTVAGTGATLGAIGTGIGMVASGAMAVLGSSFLLPALAIAGAAYGGYKAYQYLTRKEFNYTEIMRMLEYGLRGADKDRMRKIYELELYMESCSKVTDTELTIDNKKFKAEEAMAIFEISKQEPQRADAFVQWFDKRFKPIYAKWKAIVKQVGGDKLEWLEKAPGAKILEVYKLFKMSLGAYNVGASPFKNLPLNTDPKVISNFKDEWLMSLKTEAIDKKNEQLGKDVAATGAALLAARSEGKEADFTGSIGKTGADVLSLTNSVNEAGAKVQVASEYLGGAASNTVNALEAIRVKSYGLVILKASSISAIRNLETITMDFVKIDSSGKATFDGDIKEVIRKAGGYFGVAGESDFTASWSNWYMNRFLPVYLAMHSALFAITKRAELRGNLRYAERATASESLVVARAMMGAKGIWEVKDFAFKGQVAGANPSVCDENILFIENMTKEEAVKEQKAGKAAAPAAVHAAIAAKAGLTPAKTEAPKQEQSSPVKNMTVGPKTAAQGMGVSDEAEDKKYTDGAPGQKDVVKTISASGGGSLPVAPGELFSGAGGMAHMTLANGANVEGLHPSVKRLFFGMAEEYGKLTGKKIQVNTAYRSFAEQDALYKKYGPGKAARPGSSLHEYGLALDVQSADLEQLEKLGLLRKYGFTRPLGSEPWHLEPAGIFDNAVRQKAKKDHAYATSFIESGVGRGGGGLGSRGRSGELRRDDNYAKQLFDAASQTVKDKESEAPAAASAGAKMTQAASEGAASPMNGSGPSSGGGLSSGMPDVETKEGKVAYNSSAASAGGFSPKLIKDNATAANNELGKTDYSITSQVKGTVGGYASLPDATGTGWSGTGLLIKEAAKVVGVDPGLAAAIAAKESSLNPAAQGKNSAAGNNVAQGLYQFMPGTWSDMIKRYGKKFGIPENTSPLDPKANALLGMQYFKTMGDGTTVGSYLGHMLGGGGWNTFKALKDDAIPADALRSAANNNPNIFYEGGDKSRPRTKAQLMEFMGTSINKQLTDFKIPLSIETKSGATSGAATSTAAANDSSSGGSSSGPVQKYAKTIGEAAQTGYKLAPLPNRTPTAAAPVTSGLSSMSESQPVSAGVRTAPVQANDNNGLDALAKISANQLTEAEKTNGLLVEIRDSLADYFTEMINRNFEKDSGQKPKGGSATDNAVESTKKQPSTVPQSYVNRQRAA